MELMQGFSEFLLAFRVAEVDKSGADTKEARVRIARTRA